MFQQKKIKLIFLPESWQTCPPHSAAPSLTSETLDGWPSQRPDRSGCAARSPAEASDSPGRSDVGLPPLSDCLPFK